MHLQWQASNMLKLRQPDNLKQPENWYRLCISIITVNSRCLHGQLDDKFAKCNSVNCANTASPPPLLTGASQPNLCFVYIQEVGFYVLFGACQSKESHCEATKDKGTYFQKLTVKQQDFASPCNINNFDGIENSRGWLGSFKKPRTRQLLLCLKAMAPLYIKKTLILL